MSSAMMPPQTMKNRVMARYWMPMTLWSVFSRKYCFQLLTPWKEWSSFEMSPPFDQCSQKSKQPMPQRKPIPPSRPATPPYTAPSYRGSKPKMERSRNSRRNENRTAPTVP